mgnify:CR=1 FL=1
MNNRFTGTKYEEAAANKLREMGYTIIEKNFRCKIGEIDIVAKDGKYLCFIEVKYRKTERFGNPLLAVDANKQRTIINIASRLLQSYNSF